MSPALRAAAFAALSSIVATSNARAQPDSVVSTIAGNVHVTRLARLTHPWGMAFLPDGRLLVTEKPGRLRVFADGKLSEPVKGVPAVVFHEQGGLLDVEIDPAFARNQLVYLYYTEAADPQPAGARETGDPRFGDFDTTDNVVKGGAVARGRLDGDELEDVAVIWRQVPKTVGRGHFGGRLVFAPDGKLFITSGDRMRFDPAQDPASNLGKVVRIEPDGSIPSDNPYVADKDTLDDVWSLGHRNPLGAAIDPETRELWIHEMGPSGGDELNRIQARRNYGWPLASNGDNYDGSSIPDHRSKPQYQEPVAGWTPVISPSGFAFYTGERFPAWKGNALIGGLSSKALIRLFRKGNRVVGEERIEMGKRIRDVIQAPDGAVLLLVDGEQGELLRLTPEAATRTSSR
jgi:glucose/arabinose dehydrogenase